MHRRHQNWINAVNSSDIETYAQLVTKDVVWSPPDGKVIIGRAAFESWLRPFFAEYLYEFSLEDIKACETDVWIAETGKFSSRMTPLAGGSTAIHSGRFFALWRRDENGAWQIERYVDQDSLRDV